MKKIFSLLSAGLYLLPTLAFAAYQEVPETFKGPEDLEAKIVVIGNWLFTFLLVLAVIFIVFAAYKYLFSGGGEEVGKAHKMLLYAAVAVAVAFLARGMVEVVRTLVGAPAATNSQQQTNTPPVGSTGNTPSGPVFIPLGILKDAAGTRATLADSPIIEISVEQCAGAKIPAFRISGIVPLQGGCSGFCSSHSETSGVYNDYTVKGVSVSMEQCVSGAKPHFIVDGTRYPNN